MSHQPYDEWMIAGDPLPPDEQNRLNEHLANCPQCRQIKSNLQAVQTRLSTARQVSPAEGFSQRWQATKQGHLFEQQSRQVLQVRRFFLYIGTATTVSLMLLIVMFFTKGEWLSTLVETANRLHVFNQWAVQIQDFFFAVLQITPPVLPVALWIMLSTVFCILALVWIVSIWRITAQGVKS